MLCVPRKTKRCLDCMRIHAYDRFCPCTDVHDQAKIRTSHQFNAKKHTKKTIHDAHKPAKQRKIPAVQQKQSTEDPCMCSHQAKESTRPSESKHTQRMNRQNAMRVQCTVARVSVLRAKRRLPINGQICLDFLNKILLFLCESSCIPTPESELILRYAGLQAWMMVKMSSGWLHSPCSV